jgi:ubiquinone/menaquinone biosynthesis C-methylase UbiE
VTDYYSSIASGYDELHGKEQDEKLQEFLEKANLKPGITVLDVGCGTGRSIRFFAEQHWHGIEPSEGLMQHADPQAKARITKAQGENIPYPDASFDVILSLTALQNYDDAAKGLEEIKRVAKPGAVLLISFLKKSPKREMLDQLLRSRLRITESWEQEKDMMYVCTNHNAQ